MELDEVVRSSGWWDGGPTRALVFADAGRRAARYAARSRGRSARTLARMSPAAASAAGLALGRRRGWRAASSRASSASRRDGSRSADGPTRSPSWPCPTAPPAPSTARPTASCSAAHGASRAPCCTSAAARAGTMPASGGRRRRRSTSDSRPRRAARGAGGGRGGRLAPVRLPRAQSGRDAGSSSSADSIPAGCSCCCRARASRSRWPTGSSCAPVDEFPGPGACPTPGGRSCTRRWAAVVAGKRLAMEISPGGRRALSRPGADGVVELLRRLGARSFPPAPLVSRFAAALDGGGAGGPPFRGRDPGGRWRGRRSRAAVREAGTGSPRRRCRRGWSRRLEARGLVFDTPPIVGLRPQLRQPALRAAARARTRRFGRATWCCWTSGPAGSRTPSSPTRPGWVSRASRLPPEGRAGVGDGARARGTRRSAPSGGGGGAGRPIAGFEADRARAGVIEAAGFGERVRAPDRPLDRPRPARLGPAPGRLRDPRRPAAAARASGSRWSRGSICPGEFGVRSEVNVYWGGSGPEVTPREPQTRADRRVG